MPQTAERLDRTEERMAHLDAVLAHFISSTGTALNRLEREMREFKNEMSEFKNEMSKFKNEMGEFKNWAQKNIENMNSQWGNLARKMGTMVEDIFFPSTDIMIQKYFGIKVDNLMQNKRVRKDGNEFEVDILAISRAEKKAFFIEIKSNPDSEDNRKSFYRNVEKAPKFLDEINGLKLIPMYGGLTMREDTLKSLSNEGVYAIIFKGDVLEIPNFENVKK